MKPGQPLSYCSVSGEKGLKVSKSILQCVEKEVKHLGHWLSQGKKKLGPDRVSGILALPPPKTEEGSETAFRVIGIL